jgi:hypothetical protein
MGALAEAVIAAFDCNTEITWTIEGVLVVTASYTGTRQGQDHFLEDHRDRLASGL